MFKLIKKIVGKTQELKSRYLMSQDPYDPNIRTKDLSSEDRRVRDAWLMAEDDEFTAEQLKVREDWGMGSLRASRIRRVEEHYYDGVRIDDVMERVFKRGGWWDLEDWENEAVKIYYGFGPIAAKADERSQLFYLKAQEWTISHGHYLSKIGMNGPVLHRAREEGLREKYGLKWHEPLPEDEQKWLDRLARSFSV